MLYNESTGKPKVQADVFSLESLIGWLEKMPGDQEYDFQNCEGACLFGQYAAAQGMRWKSVWGTRIYDHGDSAVEFKKLVYSGIARIKPQTFGAALDRARKAAGQ